MKSYIKALICICLIGQSPVIAEDSWTLAKEIDAERISEAIAILEAKEPATLHQPTVLAFKVAVFLATDSVDTPTIGRTQSADAAFEGSEGLFSEVIVTVEFMGYPDDSLYGERFVIRLIVGEDDLWEVTKVDRSGYGRGDHL